MKQQRLTQEPLDQILECLYLFSYIFPNIYIKCEKILKKYEIVWTNLSELVICGRNRVNEKACVHWFIGVVIRQIGNQFTGSWLAPLLIALIYSLHRQSHSFLTGSSMTSLNNHWTVNVTCGQLRGQRVDFFFFFFFFFY